MQTQNESLLLLQAYMGVAAVMSMALAAAVLERRRAEQQVRATEERLRLIEARERAEQALATAQAIAHLGSWEWEIAADRLSGSDELYRIFGLEAQDFGGTYAAFLCHVHPDDRPRVDQIIQAAYRSRAPFDSFFRIVRPDGRVRIIHSRGDVVVDDSGAPTKIVGTAHDVTALKRAEAEHAQLIREQAARAEAEAAVAARDEFLSVAAHELKTPLAGLQLAVQYLLRQCDRGAVIDPQHLRRALDTVDRQSAKLARLVTQLLETVRLQTGRMQLDRQFSDLTSLVAGVVEQAQATTSHHELVLSGPPQVMAPIDALRLEQVIANLLDNAIKFSPAGGRIDVEISTADAELVRLAVRDRGIGIPRDRRQQVFERFYQAHLDSARSGLGLGLYVSRRIIELHGGQIMAEFPEDGGTRFVVNLPANGDRTLAQRVQQGTA
jgi:PAS domain S-box-containing protein